MDESILTSVKKMLGIDEFYTQFDADIAIHINSVLAILSQFGIGPAGGFSIADDSATWGDFLGQDSRLSFVKTYVYLRVRLLFDPPVNSGVTEVIKSQIAEFEWRQLVARDELTAEGENV